MSLVDTDAVVMYLINQVQKGAIKDVQYEDSNQHRKVSMRINEQWIAILSVENESQYKSPDGSVVLWKDEYTRNGYTQIRGFFSHRRTPLLFEYVNDFCIRTYEGNYLATQELIKEALPDLKLS